MSGVMNRHHYGTRPRNTGKKRQPTIGLGLASNVRFTGRNRHFVTVRGLFGNQGHHRVRDIGFFTV